MKALTLRTTIGQDGMIDLHVPSGLPPGEAEVVIVVQPAVSAPSSQASPSPSDYGVWRDMLPDVDIDADLREMTRLWEENMELSE